MKRLAFAIVAAVCAAGVSAEESVGRQNGPYQLATLSRKGYKINGGVLVRPGSQRGAIAILDQQNRVDAASFDTVKATIEKNQKIVVKVSSEDKTARPLECMKKMGADFVIAVVDDADSPVMAIAPEERWATVNVAKLAAGVNGVEVKGEFLASRLRKELLRAFAFLCGGAGSQFEDNIMCSSDVSQLDRYQEFVPADIIKRAENYMARCGVTPLRITTYRKAVQEGWAPAPTNDVQKAVWDKIHEMPTEPIKIKPETKKVAD